MRDWIFIASMCITFTVNGQNVNSKLEISIIKETLPQLLNNHPNSAASYLKDGGIYKLMYETINSTAIHDTIGIPEILLELNNLSDSISNVLAKQKIVVLLSDTLFTYKYSPKIIDYKAEYSDTIDLNTPESWENTKNDLIEVFQTNYINSGLENPVDLEFIDLIYDQIQLKSSDEKIGLNDLNNSYYEYKNDLDSSSNEDLIFHGIRLYKPVFNKNMDKACYLFSYEASNGPFRVFVFVEKHEGHWVYIEKYGSHHIDSNQNWFK
ncbi:hypothetical protein [Formosa sp. PL04]|uniref:hypothetical protein n=1 Tax=Formosa sp. PL04 TaxID=3081755 RepID=UPI002980F22E|nr:hypothetical protein [Formosa sp. PL04]MDW5288750.1 hypothetical protein [Formosa sp. PL04]